MLGLVDALFGRSCLIVSRVSPRPRVDCNLRSHVAYIILKFGYTATAHVARSQLVS